MSWQTTMVSMLRVLINDIGVPHAFSDSRLEQMIVVAARYVQNDIRLPRTYLISMTPEIIPDPTLLATPDRVFITLSVLKAGCLIDKALLNSAARAGSIVARAGDTKLNLKNKIKNYKELVRLGSCGKYEQLKTQYAFMNEEVVASVLTPSEYATVTAELTESIAGDYTLVTADTQYVAQYSVLDLNGGLLGTIVYTDPRDVFTGTVNWGDGSESQAISIEQNNGVGSLGASHTYETDGAYLVTVVVQDSQGGVRSAIFAVSVSFVERDNYFIVVLAENLEIDENALLDLTNGGLGTFTYSLLSNTHTATVDWGDGSAVENVVVTDDVGSGTLSASHTYTQSGSYLVTVAVTNDDDQTVTELMVVTVNEVAIPGDFSFTIVSNKTVPENTNLDLMDGNLGSLIYSDLDDTFTGTVNWGDGDEDALIIDYANGIGTLSAEHIYTTNNSYVVTVTVLDGENTPQIKTFLVEVTNVPIPNDFDITVTTNKTVDENEILDLNGGQLGYIFYSDLLDSFTGTVNWGDGSATDPITINYAGGDGTLGASHTYTTAGNYIVTVSVTDSSNSTQTKTFSVTVLDVPDPSDYDFTLIENQTVNEGELLDLTGSLVSLEDAASTAFAPNKFVYSTTILGDVDFTDVDDNPVGLEVEPDVITSIENLSVSSEFSRFDWSGTSICNYRSDAGGAGGSYWTISGPVTMISPLHCVAANHNKPGGGRLPPYDIYVYFRQNDGTVHRARIVGKKQLIGSDMALIRFESPVSAGVKIYPVAPQIEAFQHRYKPIWLLDQDQEIRCRYHMSEYTTSYSFSQYWPSGWTCGDCNASNFIQSGSGRPGFIPLSDGNMILLGTISTTLSLVGMSDDIIAAIQSELALYGESLQLTTIPDNIGEERLLGTFTYQDETDTFSSVINWQDGGPIESVDLSYDGGVGEMRVSHTYASSGIYNAVVSLLDDDSGIKTKSLVVTVNDVGVPGDFDFSPPDSQIVINNNQLSLTGGQLGSLIYYDLGDTFYGTIDWADGTSGNVSLSYSNGTGNLSATHTYTSTGTFVPSVTLFDDDSGSIEKSFLVSVLAGSSTIQLSNKEVVEDIVLNLASGGLGSFYYTDPMMTHSGNIDWGDGSGTFPVTITQSGGSGDLSASYTYINHGSYLARVSLTDNYAQTISGAFAVNVIDNAPAGDFDVTVTPDYYIFNNTELDLTSIAKHGILGTLTYSDLEDSFTGTINWGDDTGDFPVDVEYSGGSGTITAKHLYGEIAGENVTPVICSLNITDSQGGTRNKTFLVTAKQANADPVGGMADDYVVVYNPGGNFGAWWINYLCTWEKMFLNNEVYDFISVHDPGGQGDWYPKTDAIMRITQCTLVTDYFNSLPVEPDSANWKNWQEKSNWAGMRRGALARNKWLEIYVGGCRWGYGLDAIVGETKEEYVQRALVHLKPVTDCLPECIGLDTVMGYQPSDMTQHSDPAAVYHANLVYGADGAEAMLVAELRRRGHKIIVEPYQYNNAPYLYEDGILTAYGTWSSKFFQASPNHYNAMWIGPLNWTRVGTTATITGYTYNRPYYDSAHNQIYIYDSSAESTISIGVKGVVWNDAANTLTFTCANTGPTSGTVDIISYFLRAVRPLANNNLKFVYMNSTYRVVDTYRTEITNVINNGCVPEIFVQHLPPEYRKTGTACYDINGNLI